MILLNGKEIKPTIFPDKSSQVWKIDIPETSVYTITWKFESEAEFMHVAQLKTLLNKNRGIKILEMPFLPYGRQDKEVGNESTFALRTFASLVNLLCFDKVVTIDAHNPRLSEDLFAELINYTAKGNIIKALQETGADCLAFPDAGALHRYKISDDFPCLFANKTRDQLTGEIISISLTSINGISPKDKTVLIVDDICDGGRTFIELAKVLKEHGVKNIHLYVSHGIFSKGKEVLREAGIQRIFTKEGEC
jgi:ribose-phosphate pyrophosphokinase